MFYYHVTWIIMYTNIQFCMWYLNNWSLTYVYIYIWSIIHDDISFIIYIIMECNYWMKNYIPNIPRKQSGLANISNMKSTMRVHVPDPTIKWQGQLWAVITSHNPNFHICMNVDHFKAMNVYIYIYYIYIHIYIYYSYHWYSDIL